MLARDIDTFAAIKTLTPAYAPSDSHYTVALMTTSQTNMGTAQGTEVTKKGEFEAARDAANAAEWAFHNPNSSSPIPFDSSLLNNIFHLKWGGGRPRFG